MKKITLLLSVVFLLVAGSAINASVIPYYHAENPAGDWVKSKTGLWEGKMDGKKYWYKLDKDARLWWSGNDGKDWKVVENQMWVDKDGKWLKISNNELVWSADMGKTWAPVPDRTWEGPNGKWYKLDKAWTLWVNN